MSERVPHTTIVSADAEAHTHPPRSVLSADERATLPVVANVIFDEVDHTNYGQFDLFWGDDLGLDGDFDRLRWFLSGARRGGLTFQTHPRLEVRKRSPPCLTRRWHRHRRCHREPTRRPVTR